MAGVQNIMVTPDEAGQKLLQFLQRRIGKGIPQTAIMRWIRTGQVRLNKGRVKPFDRVAAGDIVRIPPFESDPAEATTPAPIPSIADSGFLPAVTGRKATASSPSTPLATSETGAEHRGLARLSPVAPPPLTGHHDIAERLAACGLTMAGIASGLLVLHKPAGLPVQTGTGHNDAVTTRLNRCFSGAPFMPTPAHRLDKDTSGLLLIATSYARLQALHALLRDEHAIQKVYLAWVHGQWPEQAPLTLSDTLAKRETKHGERVVRIDDNASALSQRSPDRHTNRIKGDKAKHEGTEQAASCTVYPILRTNGCTLLAISLHTGRTHQIRVQLAGRGYPILGDRKYGEGTRKNAQSDEHGMLLHAWRLMIPQSPAGAENSPASESMSSDLSIHSSGTTPPVSGVNTSGQDMSTLTAVHNTAMGLPPADIAAETFTCLPQWEKPFSVTAAMLSHVQNVLTDNFIQQQRAGHSVKK